MRHRRFLWFFLAGLLSACLGVYKNSDLAGGTSETSNGDSEASVTNADGTSSARVRVLLVDDQDWMGKAAEGRPVALDSFYTDADGVLRIKVPDSLRCNLQIDSRHEGLFLRDVGSHLQEIASSRKLLLSPYGSVSGNILWDSMPWADGSLS